MSVSIPAAVVSATITGTAPGTSLGRAVAVEARKLVNTTAGKVLACVCVLLMSVFGFGRALSPTADTTVTSLATVATAPANWIIMVMSVLLVVGEFNRHTEAITFVVEPRRGRIVAAKAITVAAAAIVASVLALGIGVAARAFAAAVTGTAIPAVFQPGRFAVFTASLILTAMTGLAWGLLTRNAPAPIVVLLLWPTLALLVASLSPVAESALAWINLEPAVGLLQPTALAWAQLATSVAAWIIVPGGFGVLRLLRGDL